MTNLNNMSNVAIPSITDFYENKSVFITGGTGYLGKVLIEKLLRSCSKLDKIFILIREKKDISVEKRKNNLLENALFARLQEENPDSVNKIILIIGDLSKPGLGISENDKKTLIDNVSVVFHMAATLRFNEPIKTAIKINVEGTQQILDLCHQMKKLDALVHVSTAYSNTDKKLVEERIYPPPATLEEVYAFVKENDADKVKEAEFLNGRPNTYTYTKALAEYEILLDHRDISTAIVRPSIVTPTLKEPIAGWLDNWNGMTTTLLGMVMGLIRVVPANGDINFDLIPVDIVVNMLIAAAVRCSRTKGLMVYNCCSGPKSPIVLSHVIRYSREHNLKNIPRLLVCLTEYKVLIFLIRLFAEILPAYLMDFWLKITGRSPKYVKLMQKFRKVIDIQEFFTTNGWSFRDDNVTELIRTMSPEDREVFYCDAAQIHWKQHLTDYIFELTVLLDKEPQPSFLGESSGDPHKELG